MFALHRRSRFNADTLLAVSKSAEALKVTAKAEAFGRADDPRDMRWATRGPDRWTGYDTDPHAANTYLITPVREVHA